MADKSKITHNLAFALRRLVAAARTAEIDHATVVTTDDGAIPAALDALEAFRREWSEMPEVPNA